MTPFVSINDVLRLAKITHTKLVLHYKEEEQPVRSPGARDVDHFGPKEMPLTDHKLVSVVMGMCARAMGFKPTGPNIDIGLESVAADSSSWAITVNDRGVYLRPALLPTDDPHGVFVIPRLQGVTDPLDVLRCLILALLEHFDAHPGELVD